MAIVEPTLAGIKLDSPLINAAGTARLLPEVQELAQTGLGAITVGSYTWSKRQGNTGNTFWYDEENATLNSLGLPNGGEPFLSHSLSSLRNAAARQGKMLIVSITDFSLLAIVALVRFLCKQPIGLIEINLGCPNGWKDGKQERIASFDLHFIDKLLTVLTQLDLGVTVGVKISPINDPVLRREIMALLASFSIVQVVTAVNTSPNGFAWEPDGRPAITAPGTKGLAGIGGKPLKQIGLAHVYELRPILRPDQDIIGVGGIFTGQDVHDYLRAGAKTVGIASALMIGQMKGEKPGEVVTRILTEYAELTS